MSREISLIIADDHPIFRQGLRQILEAEPDLRILSECRDGDEALKTISDLKPDFAVLDIDMPKMSGLQVLRALQKAKSATKVVFLTVHRSWESFDEAWTLGASGYVLKDSAVEDIVKAIRTAATGENFTSAALSEYFLTQTYRSDNLKQFKIQNLTFAERQVLKLIGEYLTNKQIADTLSISPLTVKTHRRNIISKFDLAGNNQLIKIALEYKSVL